MRPFILVALLAGCSGEAFEPADLGAVRFTPPPSYRAMWAGAETCSGRRGDFERLSWWVVPGVRTFDYDTDEPRADGLYERNRHTITLAGAVLMHPMVVRHEMLHALGFGGDHPDIPFRDPCRATWDSWDRTEAPLELTAELHAYLP